MALTLDHTDYPAELIEDGYDLNIRAGWLDDSAMMARKLGESRRFLVAGAGDAARPSKPQAPADLEDWDWLRYRHRSDVAELHGPDGRTCRVTGQTQIEVDSIDALYQFTMQDMGQTILPEHLAKRGLASGTFVHVLSQWSLRPLGIHAVWRDRPRRESLTLLLVRHLAERLTRGMSRQEARRADGPGARPGSVPPARGAPQLPR